MTHINLILPTYLAFAIKNDTLDDLEAQDLSPFNAWWADQQKRHGFLMFSDCCDYVGDAERDDYTNDHIWDCQLVTFEVLLPAEGQVIDSAEAQKK
jgi:hypothetical protein